jgi:hypothetical protein
MIRPSAGLPQGAEHGTGLSWATNGLAEAVEQTYKSDDVNAVASMP